MTKEELAAYVTDLGKQKNLPEAQIKKLVARVTADDPDDEAKAMIAVIDLPLGRQAEFSRELEALKAKHTTLDTWHKGAKAAFDSQAALVKDRDALIAKYKGQFGDLPADGSGGNGNPNPNPAAPTTPKLEEMLASRDQFYLRLQADIGRAVATHARMFKGEIIDSSELLADIGKAANETVPRQITVQQAYEARYGDRIKAETERGQKEHDQKLIDQGAAAERKRLVAAGARPTGATLRESSTLFKAIATTDDKKDADRTRTPEDNLTLFEQELEQEMVKAEQRVSDAATT